MRNIWTIARREFQHYFISPLAYVIGLMILLVTGVLFTFIVNFSVQYAMNYGYTTAPDTKVIMQWMAILFLFTLPTLTMRLLADEYRSGTLELLLTSPVKDWELVIGKWAGSFLFILCVIAVTLIYPLALNKMVTPGLDQGVLAANYLGIILVAAACLAIGTAISSIFNNQFAAFFLTILILLFLWFIMPWPANLMQNAGGEIFTYLGMSSHFESMLAGTVNLSDIVYYLSLTGLGLFLGTIAVEIRRWR